MRAVMAKHGLEFEDRDIWNDIEQRVEMIQKEFCHQSQSVSPSRLIQALSPITFTNSSYLLSAISYLLSSIPYPRLSSIACR